MSSSHSAPRLPEGMTLVKCIEEVEKAIHLFLDNQFIEAKDICIPWQNLSVYHALGTSTLTVLEALFTFEREHFGLATTSLESSLEVCDSRRKSFSIKQTIGNFFTTKTTYDNYTEEEVHADLCYCECLLFRSAITFMEDESLGSFIKGAMRMRTSFNTYKQCGDILKCENWSKWTTKLDFESGVKLGLGTFNVIVALLPPKVVKLLEFIGFSSDKAFGLKCLEEGCHVRGMRRPFCIAMYLSYHLIIVFMLTYFKGDLRTSENVLKPQLAQHPNGVIFLFFKARLEFMKGHLNDGISWYIKMWKSQISWPQINSFAFWDLLFIYSLKQDWENAAIQAQNLLDVSKWSKCIYSYQKAAILIMMDKREKNMKAINELMKKVPEYKQRIAGKSIPSEKFVCTKSERYFEQLHHLFLPMYEFLYVWNYFKLIDQNHDIGEKIIVEIDKSLLQLDVPEPMNKFDYDNKAVLLLVKGACLRQLGSLDPAMECFQEVLTFEKRIVSDMYVIPYAKAEIGLVYFYKHDKTAAIRYFDDARKNYSGFPLENRLNFRIQSVLVECNK